MSRCAMADGEAAMNESDSDQSGTLSYAEVRDGLKKFKIALTEQEWDSITFSKRLCTKAGEINAARWDTIMRSQMVMYCHRQLAVSIPAVLRDDKHLGILLFTVKLILDRTPDIKPADLIPQFDFKDAKQSPSESPVAAEVADGGKLQRADSAASIDLAGWGQGHIHSNTFRDLQLSNRVNVFGATLESAIPKREYPSPIRAYIPQAPGESLRAAADKTSDGKGPIGGVFDIHLGGSSFGYRGDMVEGRAGGEDDGEESTSDRAMVVGVGGGRGGLSGADVAGKKKKCKYCVGICRCVGGGVGGGGAVRRGGEDGDHEYGNHARGSGPKSPTGSAPQVGVASADGGRLFFGRRISVRLSRARSRI